LYINKHIVITGASSGIGFALANKYLQLNANVSICARNITNMISLQTKYNTIFVQKADISIEQDCKSFIENAIAKNGPIDILINNAGISMRGMFDGINLEVLQNVMNINYWGTVYTTYFALPSIKQTKGVICSISSIAGYRGLPARSGYSSSKFAIQGFMESLRTELLQTGVHVMWICPGFTNSNIRNVALAGDGKPQKETPLEESKLMSSETCADLIIQAIIKRKRSAVFTIQGKLTVWINKLFPAWADKLVFQHFANEKDSPLKN
jgi:short-subunit dehydrogenase